MYKPDILKILEHVSGVQPLMIFQTESETLMCQWVPWATDYDNIFHAVR